MAKNFVSEFYWEREENRLAGLVADAKKLGIKKPNDREWDKYCLENGITNKASKKVLISGAITFLEDKIAQKKSAKKIQKRK